MDLETKAQRISGVGFEKYLFKLANKIENYQYKQG
jgi:hypothetical protein